MFHSSLLYCTYCKTETTKYYAYFEVLDIFSVYMYISIYIYSMCLLVIAQATGYYWTKPFKKKLDSSTHGSFFFVLFRIFFFINSYFCMQQGQRLKQKQQTCKCLMSSWLDLIFPECVWVEGCELGFIPLPVSGSP